MEKAKQTKNKLTYSAVADVLEATDLDKNQMDDIYEALMSRGIEIISETETDFDEDKFIDDVKKIRGELIVLRPSIETCVSRSVERKQAEHPELSTEELKNYEQRRRETLYRLNPFLNEMVSKVAEFATFEEFIIEKTNKGIKL